MVTIFKTIGFLVLTLTASSAIGQDWEDIATFPVHEAAPYFLNENYGFVFTPGLQGPVTDIATDPISLWRTTDGGMTWQLINLGIGVSGNIEQLCFVSSSHGYMAVDASWSGIGSHGLYETNDSGSHWHKLVTQNNFAFESFISVYAADSLMFAITAPSISPPATLLKSSNAGLNWQPVPSVTKPESVTGNRENLLEASGPNEEVNGGWYLGSYSDSIIFVSSNSGIAWTTAPPSWIQRLPVGILEQWNQFVFPHSQTIVLAEEFFDLDTSAIIVSSDGGLNWHIAIFSIFGKRGGFYPGINDVAGDGCVVYVQRTSESIDSSFGFLRSTDNGQTWVNVGGPTHECDARTVSVVGHGAVVYAIADSIPGSGCHLWKTGDGGDGALSSAINPVVTAGYALPSGSSGNTLITKLCDTASLSLWLQFIADNCDYGGLTGVTIDGIDSTTAAYTTTSTHHPWSENKPDTAWATIYPIKPGTYPLTVHAHYTDDDFLGGDTTFSIILVIKDNPGTLAATPSKVDFGTESLCSPKTLIDTVSITASGCESVTIDSIVFSPRAGGSNFTFKPVTKGFALGASGGVKKYPVGYLASLPETDSGIVLVYTSNGIDTIQVRGAGAENSRSFTAATDTARAAMCDSSTETVTLQNTTCGILVIDSITIPNDFSIPLGSGGSPQLPLGLGKGLAGSVTLQFTPSLAFDVPGTGERQAIAHVRLIELGDTLSFDTLLNIQTIVSRGKPAMTLSPNSLDFGSVSTCGQSVTLPVVINSTGCDTLIYSGAVPAPPFRVVRGDSAALPVGVSDTVSVTFTPTQSGQFTDTLTILTSAGTGTVPLRGIGVADRVALALPATTLALPQVIAGCGADTAMVFFSNAGCKGITIDSVVGLSAPFSAGTINNHSLASGDTAMFQIYFAPTLAQLKLGATRIFYHGADGLSRDTTINISASATQRPSLSVYLKSGPLSAKDQEVVSIPVYASSASSVSGMGSISFRLDMRTDLLTPETISSEIPGAGTAPLLSDKSGASITLTLPANYSISSEVLLASISCRAYVTDTSHGTIALSDSSSSSAANCLSITGSGEETFALIPECGSNELTQFLSTGKIFTIEGIVPNPAGSSIQVSLSKLEPFPVMAELYDLLGARILSQRESEAEFSLDLGTLPAGSYFLRLSTDGETVTRRIAVVK